MADLIHLFYEYGIMVLWLPLVLHDGGTAPATDHTTSPKQRKFLLAIGCNAFQETASMLLFILI
jgi:hypothetical protein